MMYDADEEVYEQDPFADPDFMRDSMMANLRESPVPCAICGDDEAWRIVVLAPGDIAYGPVAYLKGIPIGTPRGVCGPCFEGRAVTQRLDYSRTHMNEVIQCYEHGPLCPGASGGDHIEEVVA